MIDRANRHGYGRFTLASPAPVAVSRVSSTAGSESNYLAPLAVLTTLFFMWGFITCLNDIIIPHLKAVFELNYAQAMLIQFAFFTAYFVVSLPSGLIVNKLGYKNGIIIGLVTAGVGCLLFYPAASARSYPLFLLALFILASGITLLQVAANPFVAILGKPETASSRLTMTQALNSLGTTIAPIFGSMLILSTVVKSPAELKQLAPQAVEAYRLAEASSVQTPYLGLAGALIVLAVAIALFKLPKIDAASGGAEAGADDSESHKSAWSYRHLVLGAVGIFVYVGAEVAIGSFLVNYFKEPSIGGLTEAQGAHYVAYYWGGAMIGRFIGTATLRLVKPGKLLAYHALVAAVLVLRDHALDRARRDVDGHRGRALQLDHVPDDLHHRDRRPRQAHRPGLGDSVHGDRRRRADSGDSGRARRSHRHPPLLHHPGPLLPLHRLVRRLRSVAAARRRCA